MKNSLHFSGMYKALWGVLFLLISLTGAGQITIFQEDFEDIPAGNIGTWQKGYFGDRYGLYPYNDFYVQSACTTNLINGTKSMQITGITATGATCAYQNAPSNTDFEPIIYHQIDATGYTDITLSYKWKCAGEVIGLNYYDYGELYYSLDGQLFYLLETHISKNNNNNPTSVVDYDLPEEVENTTFYIAWGFVYDHSVSNGLGLTIDDIEIKGTSTCQPITATASAPVICEDDETTLSVSGQPGYTYTWYLNYDSTNNTGDFVGSGSSITVSPEESTLYAVVSNCGSYDFVSVAINPPPTAIVQSPIQVNNCESDEVIHELTVESGGTISNIAFSETFNPDSSIPWLVETSVSGGAGPSAASWGLYNSSTTFHSIDNSDFAMVDSDGYGNFSINSKLISPVFSLADYSDASLSFEHHYRNRQSTARVEISTDMGENWTSLAIYSSNQGEATNFLLTTINLNAYAGQPAVMIRFNYEATWGWYWAVDNITVTGTPKPTTFSWSPIAGLYIDETATIPYNGENLDTVYAMPENGGIYTVTATSSVGCATTAEIEIIGGISIWNGTAWANNISPNDDRKAVFRGDYNSTGDIEACSCLVESGNVVINSNDNLIVHNGLEVNSAGSLTIKSDANLLQINPAENIGVITVEREANVPFNQYNFWSSPVVGQNLYEIYENIPDDRVMTYNTDDDYYTIVPNPTFSEFGIGYSIKGPSSGGPAVTSRFIGVPHNESATTNSIPLATDGQGFNLIGNPFPSNLNIKELYDDNNTVIDPSFYFWDNTNNTALTQQGSGYSGVNFAVYNANFEDGTHAANFNGDQSKVPNGIVKPGQGFLVQAISGSSLGIDNSMRTIATKIDSGDDDAPYYKNGSSGVSTFNGSRPKEGKFWLELVNQAGIEIQIAIGYFADADSDFDKFDTSVVNESASDNLYSYSADAAKLTINGRSAFSKDDVVPLGVNLYEYGKYKIKLDKTKGIFNTHQTIYLKDKYLNKIHNLSDSDYEFEGAEGEYTDRFEILYKLPLSDAAELTTANMNQLRILQLNEEILISSTKDKILEVEVFNLAGWSIYQKSNVNANEWKIPSMLLGKQIIVVKVLTQTGEVVTKKIINK